MPTRRLPSSRATTQVQKRALYDRTNADFAVNSPDGFPSEFPPIWWVGSDQLQLNASWNHGGWNQPFAPAAEGPALAVVNRATSLVVDPIAQSPLKLQDSASGSRPLVTPRWLTDPMLCRPDSRLSSTVYPDVLKVGRAKFWGDLIRSALWWGHGFLLFSEDESGAPQAGTLKILNPHLVTTERVDGSLRWVVGTGEDRAVFGRDGRLDIGGVHYHLTVLRNPASEVSSEGLSMGVFAMSPSAFGIAGQVERYTSGVFSSGVPSGYLSALNPSTTKDQVDDLRSQWMAHHGGDRRSVAVLSASVTYTPVSLSPVDVALAEVARLSYAGVAFAFSIDPNMLGAGLQNSASYNNVRDYFRQHRDFGIGIWIAALQDLLSALLPGTQTVVVDTDSFTRPEPAERYSAYAVALDNGILTVDEIRANEGLPPLPAAAVASPEETRSLSAAETSQKVYLAVTAGVLSVVEARQMINAAGGNLDVEAVPELAAPPAPPPAEPTDLEAQRSLRVQPWMRR